MTDKDKINEKKKENVLTCIHDAYTVSATTETVSSEVDRVIVRKFLETLAEIALDIASRNTGEERK